MKTKIKVNHNRYPGDDRVLARMHTTVEVSIDSDDIEAVAQTRAIVEKVAQELREAFGLNPQHEVRVATSKFDLESLRAANRAWREANDGL